MDHYLRGSIVESLVLSDLLKQYYNADEQPMIYYWRDSHGHEVDCIIERNNKLVALEIKGGRTLSTDFFEQLAYFKNLSDQSTENILIYAGNENHSWPQARVISWQNVGKLIKD